MAIIEARKETRKNNSQKHEREREEWIAKKKVGRSKQVWVSDGKTVSDRWVRA